MILTGKKKNFQRAKRFFRPPHKKIVIHINSSNEEKITKKKNVLRGSVLYYCNLLQKTIRKTQECYREDWIPNKPPYQLQNQLFARHQADFLLEI